MPIPQYFILIIITLLAFSNKTLLADSNTIRFHHLSKEDGLSDDFVGFRGNNIIQDRQGYLWFGTPSGLNRFDGSDFKIFRHIKGDKNSLSHDFIYSLYEDSDGFVWVGTEQGLNRFDPGTERFERILTQHPQIRVNDMAEDEGGHLWLGTDNDGLIQLDRKSLEFKQYKHLSGDISSLTSDRVLEVLVDERGRLWAGTPAGLNRFEPNTEQFLRYIHNDSDPSSLSDNYIIALHEDKDGRLWLGTYNGLNRFDESNERFVSYLKKTAQKALTFGGGIPSILSDHQGNLWVAVFDDGLCLFNEEQGDCQDIHFNERAEKTSLLSEKISMLFQDKQKTIWIATPRGASYFLPNQKQFKYFANVESIDGRERQQYIQSMLYDSNDRLWIGGTTGLSVYDKKTNVNKRYVHNPKDVKSLSSNSVFSVIEDSNNNIWVGAYDGYLNRFDPDNDNFIRYTKSPKLIFNLYEDKKKRFWIGTRNGLYQFDKEKNSFINHSEDFGIKVPVDPMLSDSFGNLWVGTEQGLWQIREDLSFTKHQHHLHDSNSISSSAILSIYEDTNKQLWIGTMDGLNRFERDTQGFVRFKINDSSALKQDIVTSVTEGSTGDLWVLTEAGISRFNPTTLEKNHYLPSDGLLEGYKTNVHLKLTSGELVFGGPLGYTQFMPSEIHADLVQPSMVFTELRLSNHTVTIGDSNDEKYFLSEPIQKMRQLDFAHNNKAFGLKYSALNAMHPKNYRYFHRLVGWDKDWIETEFVNREARYENLPAGKYVLNVKVEHENSGWKESISSIAINIASPWWWSYWAFVVYLLCLISLVYYLVYLRTRYLVRRSEKLEFEITQRTEKIAKQKQTIENLLSKKDQLFANVSHEFRTPLALIKLPIDKAIEKIKGKKIKEILTPALVNISRLQRMVDQLLDLARLDIQPDQEKSPIELSNIINYVVNSMQSLAEERQLNIKLNIQTDLWVKASKDALEKIIINLLSNAIKYTPKLGAISIEARRVGLEIELKVADSGIGIASSEHEKIFERFVRLDSHEDHVVPGAGIGLALVKQLVETLGGTISISSEVNRGTVLTLLFPATSQSENRTSNAELELAAIVQQENEVLSSRQVETNLTDDEQVITDADKQSVLIIEDHPEMLNILADIISPYYDCILAKEGAEGVSKAFKYIPSLIISDLMMPKISGIELSDIIRKDTRTSHIPIILLTANCDLETRLSAWRSHIDDYIEKPFDKEELLFRCHNLLNIRLLLSKQFTNGEIEEAQEKNGDQKLNYFNLLNDKDKIFIEKIESLISDEFKNSKLNAKKISTKLAMSESQLHRKMKALINQSVSEYVRNYRLQQGAKLLNQGQSVTEVAINVGFSSPSYFSSCFKIYFGVSPKQFQSRSE